MKIHLLKITVVAIIANVIYTVAYAQNFGTALHFDGVDDHVKVPNNNNLLEPANLTLEAWFKKDRINSPWGKDRIMISVANNGWGLGFNGNNKMFFTKTGMSEVGMDTVLADTLWHHVAVTHNGTITTFYLDGQLESVKPNNVGYGSTGIYTIASRGSNGEFFQGEIDDIRIWNVIRTQQEIENTMCTQLNGSETGLIAYYNFNDASGDSLKDAVSANNGELFNVDTVLVWVPSAVPCVVTPGINENIQNHSLIIYPNPFSVSATIQVMNYDLKETKYELIIYNLLGNVIKTQKISNSIFELQKENLSEGIYFVQIKNENVIIATKKIIVQ